MHANIFFSICPSLQVRYMQFCTCLFLWPETESNYLIYTSIYIISLPNFLFHVKRQKTMTLYEVPVFNLYNHFKLRSIISLLFAFNKTLPSSELL